MPSKVSGNAQETTTTRIRSLPKPQEDALSSQLADLESELSEYESLKAGEFQLDSLK